MIKTIFIIYLNLLTPTWHLLKLKKMHPTITDLLLRYSGETTTQCLCTDSMRRGSWSYTKGKWLLYNHLVQRLVWKRLWEDRRPWRISSHNHFWMNHQAPISEKFGLCPVYWHQWRLMWSLGLWREEWFDFLSTKISSWLCATLYNSSTVNYIPGQALFFSPQSLFQHSHYCYSDKEI